MRLEDGNGLDVIAALSELRPQARTIVLTGYGNIATAVTAVKLGAVDYLAKPADADDVTDALLAPHDEGAAAGEPDVGRSRALGAYSTRLRAACNRNVSETARRLNMHRRTPAADSRQARAEVTGEACGSVSGREHHHTLLSTSAAQHDGGAALLGLGIGVPDVVGHGLPLAVVVTRSSTDRGVLMPMARLRQPL